MSIEKASGNEVVKGKLVSVVAYEKAKAAKRKADKLARSKKK